MAVLSPPVGGGPIDAVNRVRTQLATKLESIADADILVLTFKSEENGKKRALPTKAQKPPVARKAVVSRAAFGPIMVTVHGIVIRPNVWN